MLLSLVSIVSFQPVPRAAPATARAARTAISMQLPDFGKSLQGMMPGGGGDDSGLSKEQAEEMEARMKTGGMTFDDFLMQTKVMQKAGAPLAVESGPHHAAGLPCEGCRDWPRVPRLHGLERVTSYCSRARPCDRQHAAHDAEHLAASPHL